MASPEVHSKLGPSGAARWIHCPPSVALTDRMPDEQTIYAAEGTAAHALAEYKVCCALHLPHGKRPSSDYDSDDMEEGTDEYCLFCTDIVGTEKAEGRDPLVKVEEHVEYETYVEGGFGQCDFLVVSEGRLHIVDFKFGKGVPVGAEHNEQMMLYALGALLKYDFLFGIDEITMTIFQPRLHSVSTWKITAKELLSWAENIVKPAAALACRGEGEFHAGAWCRFCKARASCRERARENLSVAQYEFQDPALLSDDEIAEVLSKADEVKRWCEDVYTYAQEVAISQGRKFEGFKVVKGRQGNRKFTDPDMVEKAARDAGYTDIYNTSLISLTQFEKKMGEKKFSEILGKFVTREEGKLTLVPVSDKRQEVVISTAAEAAEEFKED